MIGDYSGQLTASPGIPRRAAWLRSHAVQPGGSRVGAGKPTQFFIDTVCVCARVCVDERWVWLGVRRCVGCVCDCGKGDLIACVCECICVSVCVHVNEYVSIYVCMSVYV